MLGDLTPVSFVPTIDVERARSFYVDVLGLPVLEESPFALVLRSGGGVIRVTPVESHSPAGHTILGWTVSDMANMLRALTSLGVETLRFPWFEQDDQGVWTAPGGAHVAWFHDPDGNTLSLTQPAPRS